MKRTKFTITTKDDLEMELPTRREVCFRCNGEGTHDHPAFSNGITASEWNGPDWDDDSREAYLTGRYDVQCEECKGRNVVDVPDVDAMTPEQSKAYAKWCDDERLYRSIQRAERMMGA